MTVKRDYEKNQWLMACDQCGQISFVSQMKRRWDGAWVDEKCFEMRQPQDFVRGVLDKPNVPVSRPRGPFELGLCTFDGLTAFAGIGVAGCMIAGRTIR